MYDELNNVLSPFPISAPTREMIEAYRRRKMMQQSNPHRRAQVLLDSDSEEDEFDPEMEGFIDDGEDDGKRLVIVLCRERFSISSFHTIP